MKAQDSMVDDFYNRKVSLYLCTYEVKQIINKIPSCNFYKKLSEINTFYWFLSDYLKIHRKQIINLPYFLQEISIWQIHHCAFYHIFPYVFGTDAVNAQFLAECLHHVVQDSVLPNQCDMHHIQFWKEENKWCIPEKPKQSGDGIENTTQSHINSNK